MHLTRDKPRRGSFASSGELSGWMDFNLPVLCFEVLSSLSLSCSLLSISVLLIYRTSSTTKYLELNHRAYIYIYIFKLRIKCRKKANVYLSFSWNRDKTLATAAFLSVERQSVVTITRILVNRNIRFLILLF